MSSPRCSPEPGSTSTSPTTRPFGARRRKPSPGRADHPPREEPGTDVSDRPAHPFSSAPSRGAATPANDAARRAGSGGGRRTEEVLQPDAPVELLADPVAH